MVIDGTWIQARAMLKRNKKLSALPRVSSDTAHRSEYRCKAQLHPNYLSTVEGVRRKIEALADCRWNRGRI